MEDCIAWPSGEGPTPYQLEILANLIHYGRESARGPHGLGKSSMAAIAVHWYALTRDGKDWKIVTTASVWAQLIRYLWPEVHKWARYIRWDIVGRDPYSRTDELFAQKLRLKTGEAFAIASDDSQRIEGAHADHMFYIFDESKIVPDPTWDSVEGAMSSKGERFWLAVSTPGEPVGRFYDIQTKQPGYDDWHVRPVTLREAVDSGRIDPVWADARRKQWGPKSTMYINRVEGNFASGGEETVIPAEWVDSAIARSQVVGPLYVGPIPEIFSHRAPITHVGCDIARKGGDSTIYFLRSTDICYPPTTRGAQDTMETAGDIVSMVREHPYAIFLIDVIGVGAGVYDRVLEVFEIELDRLAMDRVFPFVASARTEWTDISEQLRFVDTRSAAWWNMRQLLDPSRGSLITLPNDRDLRSELVAPGYKSLSDGRIKVESKDDIRLRLGRSTNLADALIMSYWDEAYTVGIEYG